MKPLRSLLFVPGNKPDWIARAPQYGADGLILDVEDSVPPAEKPSARAAVRRMIDSLRQRGETTTLVVRVNDLTTGLLTIDLEEVLCAGLDGIVVPKVDSAADIKEIDRLLLYAEGRAGLPAGQTEIIATLESTPGMRNAYDIAIASPRVASLVAGIVPGADAARSLGIQWSGTELETLFVRSKVVLDGRAAGLRYLLTGFWPDIRDLEGVEKHSVCGRQLGFTGELLVHPSHVPICNRVYTPSAEEIAHAEGVLTAMAEAERQGTAAVTYKGAMLDIAMIKTANELLDFARKIGVYNGRA